MKNFLTKAFVCAGVIASAMVLSSMCVWAATYTLDASNLTSGDITTDTTAGTDNFFTLNANSSKKLTVEAKSSGKYVAASNSITGTDITKRLKTNGTSSSEGRNVKFTVATTATVTVQGAGGGETGNRVLQLFDSNYSAVTGKSLSQDATNTVDTSFEVNPGTYYLGATGNAFNIYAVIVETNETTPSLTVNPTSVTVQNGNTATITATLLNSDDTLNWSIDDETVVTKSLTTSDGGKANNTCTLTAIKVGSTTVTVSAGDLSREIPVKVTKVPEVISITPTTSGSTTTYTFTGHSGDTLTTDNALVENTAYASDYADTSVEFVEGGAKLVDNSSSKSAQLNVPVSNVNSGMLKVEGSVTSSAKTGGSWALVNIGGLVYVGADKDKNICIMPQSSQASDGKWVSVTPNAGALTADTNVTVTYEVTLDLDNGTFSGKVNGTTYNNVPFTKGTVSYISFVTNGTGTGTSARVLTIPSVSYTTSEREMVSTKYAAASNVAGSFVTTNAGGVEATAKYVFANSNGYFVIDFDLSGVNDNVTGLKYQGNNINIYKAVKFGEGDTIAAADDHGFYAYIVKDGTAAGVTINGATITAVTE